MRLVPFPTASTAVILTLRLRPGIRTFVARPARRRRVIVFRPALILTVHASLARIVSVRPRVVMRSFGAVRSAVTAATAPLGQVRAWYELARAEGVAEPEAAALATATPDGRPSVRMVLVRGIDARGVAFYTNRESRKGRELAAKLGAMKVGRGTEDDVKVGPLIDANQRDKVDELVRDALGKGAQAVVGGTARDGAGYFYEPTVLAGVSENAELLREEIFGPVAPVIGFDDEEAAIAAANATEYGLVAYVYTSDIKRAFRVCEGLQTGMVGLNQGLVSNPAAPFGGGKASGFGREGGREGIEEYLETKYVAMAM